MSNDTRTVRTLLEAGASLDTPNSAGAIALHHAAWCENIELMRYLKAAGSWLHATGGPGRTALHLAVMGGSAAAVKEVLSWNVIEIDAGLTISSLRCTARQP
jgi:ankyrin repeat protein